MAIKHYADDLHIIKGKYFLFGTQGKIRMQYFYIPIAFNTSYTDHNNPKTSFNILGWEKLEQDFGEHKSKEFAVEELTV